MADNVVRCDVAIGVSGFPQGPNRTYYGSAIIRCRCNPSGELRIIGRVGHGQTTLAVSGVLTLIYALQLARFMQCANIRLLGPLPRLALHNLIDLREPRAPEADNNDHQHQGYMRDLDSDAIALLNSFESIVYENGEIWGPNVAAMEAFHFNLGQGHLCYSGYLPMTM